MLRWQNEKPAGVRAASCHQLLCPSKADRLADPCHNIIMTSVHSPQHLKAAISAAIWASLLQEEDSASSTLLTAPCVSWKLPTKHNKNTKEHKAVSISLMIYTNNYLLMEKSSGSWGRVGLMGRVYVSLHEVSKQESQVFPHRYSDVATGAAILSFNSWNEFWYQNLKRSVISLHYYFKEDSFLNPPPFPLPLPPPNSLRFSLLAKKSSWNVLHGHE